MQEQHDRCDTSAAICVCVFQTWRQRGGEMK